MRPATFLPWRQSKIFKYEIQARGVKVAECVVEDDADYDAVYIVHACNYYPHMVAMLRDLILHPDGAGYGATMARGYQLLEAMGELTTEGG